MLMSFWDHVSSLRIARRPQLLVGIAILMLTCGLTAACSTASSTVGSSPTTGLPTVTSGNSSTATDTAAGSTPSSGGSLACTSLNSLVPVLQAGKLHVTFEMAVGTTMSLKGSVTKFHNNSGLTMDGQGYLVSPNDPIQIQIVQTAGSVQITVKNMTTSQVTNYTATACSAKTSTDIELTGTDPSSFTLDILITP